MNKFYRPYEGKQAGNAISGGWHNIGKRTDVRQSITYRTITVGIGILVAVVIALTLWISGPESPSPTGLTSRPKSMATPSIKKLISTTFHVLGSAEVSGKH